MSDRPGFVDIRKSLIHFPSLSLPLRVLTGFGIAQVLGGILVLLFKDAPVATIPVGQYAGQIIGIGWPFLVIGSLLLVTGWTYLLAGALQARWWIAFGILILATIALWQMITVTGGVTGPIAAVTLWIYVLIRQTRLRRLGLRADLPVLTALLATINLSPVVAALVSHDATRLLQFSLGVGGQVVTLLVLLIPVLIIAGLDLTEISAETGAWLADSVLNLAPFRVALAGLFIVAALKTALELHAATHPLITLLVSIPAAALLSVGVASIIVAMRRIDKETEPPGFGLILLLSYALFVVFILALLLADKGSGGAAAASSLNQLSVQSTWTLAGLAVIVLAIAMLVIRRLRKRPPSGTLLFLLIYGVWILLSVGDPRAMLPDAFRSPQMHPLISLSILDLAVTFAVVGGIGLLARLRRLNRQSLGYIVAVLAGLTLLQGIDGLYGRQIAPTDVVSIGQLGLFLALLVFACYRTLRTAKQSRRRQAILGLILCVPLLAGDLALLAGSLTHVLPKALALPEAAVGVLILAIGLCWDLLMSGERFTNQHSERFPRHGRLLFYLGYVSLAAAALLWTKTLQHIPIDASFFDEGTLPPFGIIVLGVPMLIYLWALAGHRLWNTAAPDPAPGK